MAAPIVGENSIGTRLAWRSFQTAIRCSASSSMLERRHWYKRGLEHWAFEITNGNGRKVGRISGAKRIPISELKVGSFHRVENRRLQVNESTIRYQKQLKYLASMI
jgi:hypothetical protein